MSTNDVDTVEAAEREMKAAQPRRLRRWLGWSAIGLFAAGGAAAVIAPSLQARPQSPADAALAFCATTPADALVTSSDTPDHRYAARVPADNPANILSSTSYSIAKGDVIEFDVASPRPGMVAVHGLHDLQAVQAGGTISIAFRAIYTGRFPLHFHGADGSHFELAALEVLPSAAAAPPGR